MGQLQYTRKEKMKLKDKTMKEFLENNAYFVDFFNAYFFDGQKVGTTSRKRTHKIDKF